MILPLDNAIRLFLFLAYVFASVPVSIWNYFQPVLYLSDALYYAHTTIQEIRSPLIW